MDGDVLPRGPVPELHNPPGAGAGPRVHLNPLSCGCHQVSHHLPTSRGDRDVLWEARAVGDAKASDSTGMSSVLALCTWTQDTLHHGPSPGVEPPEQRPQCQHIPGALPFAAAVLEPPALNPGKPKGAECEAAVELLWSWSWDRDMS